MLPAADAAHGDDKHRRGKRQQRDADYFRWQLAAVSVTTAQTAGQVVTSAHVTGLTSGVESCQEEEERDPGQHDVRSLV